ncbi:MAG: UvrD-helicase domain-containing protein [Treponema sp.]|nr:UvrD-helicase domain-containing protein [Treponema sp.]
MSKLNIRTELNEPQIQAVTSITEPALIIAGAGSGKTRVITYRIAYMLEKGIPQHAILALTFTNKAAKEMEIRVRELTEKKLQSLTISTFHAFGLSIIRNEAELLGFRKNFSIYDETDRMTLIKESLRECRMASKKVDLYALGQLFSNIKTGLAAWNEDEVTMKPVYEEYQHGLKVYNAVDFDDLLTLPLALFEEHPDVLEKYRQRYRYIMVDEFQDTSLIQYKLMRLLASGGTVSNICVVGDDDQSIYSWRGANYRNIAMFEQDFPGLTEIKLEQNYRSTSTILEAANGVIAHNSNRKGKTLWSGKGGGRPIELHYPENESAEADFIASQIRNLSTTEGLRYHDFGVLTRTNSLAGNIEEAFLAENIPYKVSGGTSFFQRKEIKDIISYLRVIANPHDDVSLLRIINTPGRGIGKATIAVLNDIARKNKTGIWDALSRLNHSRQEGQQHLFQDKKILTELEEFMQLIETQRTEILERQGKPGQPWSLSQKTRALVDTIDYWGYLVAEHGKEEKKARWKFGNIEYFIRMIENWERDPDTMDSGLYPWLNRISLITKDDGETDNLGKVSLMTIHSAKGLEFPVVFIADAEEGLIPHEKSITDEHETPSETAGSIEEERRLFYVAITRAREKLYITSCQKRRRMHSSLHNSEKCTPSPFLEEIPRHLIQQYQPISPADEEALADDLLKKLKARFKGNN